MATDDEKKLIEQYVDGRAKAARDEHGPRFLDLVCVVASLVQSANSIVDTVGRDDAGQTLGRTLFALGQLADIEIDELRAALRFIREMNDATSMLIDSPEGA